MGRTDIAKVKIKRAIKEQSNELDLSGLSLTSKDLDKIKFGKQVNKLKNLQILDLKNNQIDRFNALKLPRSIQTLDLRNNDLFTYESMATLHEYQVYRNIIPLDPGLDILMPEIKTTPEEWQAIFGKEQDKVAEQLGNLKYKQREGVEFAAIHNLENLLLKTREQKARKYYIPALRKLTAPVLSEQTSPEKKQETLRMINFVANDKEVQTTIFSNIEALHILTHHTIVNYAVDRGADTRSHLETPTPPTTPITPGSPTSFMFFSPDSANAGQHQALINHYTGRFTQDIVPILANKNFDIATYSREGKLEKNISDLERLLQRTKPEELEDNYNLYLITVKSSVAHEAGERDKAILINKFLAEFSQKTQGQLSPANYQNELSDLRVRLEQTSVYNASSVYQSFVQGTLRKKGQGSDKHHVNLPDDDYLHPMEHQDSYPEASRRIDFYSAEAENIFVPTTENYENIAATIEKPSTLDEAIEKMQVPNISATRARSVDTAIYEEAKSKEPQTLLKRRQSI